LGHKLFDVVVAVGSKEAEKEGQQKNKEKDRWECYLAVVHELLLYS